jgi:hypothetical protein
MGHIDVLFNLIAKRSASCRRAKTRIGVAQFRRVAVGGASSWADDGLR